MSWSVIEPAVSRKTTHRGDRRRRPVGPRRPPALEILEGRLCLSLTVGLSRLTGTVGSPFTADIQVQGGGSGDTYQYSLLTPPGSPPAPTTPPGVALNGNALSGTPTAPGVYDVLVSVTDQTTGETASGAFPLTIAPLITLGGSLGSGTEYTPYDGGTITATGPASDSYTFTAKDLPPGLSLEPLSATTVRLKGNPTRWGTYAFTLTATDGNHLTGSRTYQVAIGPAITFSPAPIAGDYGTDKDGNPIPFPNILPNAVAGQAYHQTITASSSHGGVASIAVDPTSWNGLTISGGASGVQIMGTPTTFTNPALANSIAPLDLKVTATDGDGGSDTIHYVINVEPSTAAPTVPIQAQIGQQFYEQLPAAQVDQPYGDTTIVIPGSTGFKFSLMVPSDPGDSHDGIPPGMTFDADHASLTGTPTNAGVYSFIIHARDETTGITESRVFQLTVSAAPGGVQIGPAAIPLASPGAFYNQQITATGGSGPVTLSYSLINGTEADLTALGLKVSQVPANPGALVLSGTPTGSTPFSFADTPHPSGRFSLQVKATDGQGHTSTHDYPIEIYYTPQQIRHAYGLDQVVLSGGVIGDGTGQTVAIIDEGDAPNLVSTTDPNFAYSDLHAFDARFGLPDPPKFLKLDAFGGTNYPSATSQGDPGETMQDVEWVHALAPGANIILLEAQSLLPGDVFEALQTARSWPGVSVVSMSFHVLFDDNSENSPDAYSETTLDPLFVAPGGHPMTFVAASGDEFHGSYLARYPAVSPDVLSVGYTGLTLNAQGGYGAEGAIHGAGGGASVQELQPGWQGVASSASATMRTTPDVTFNGSIPTAVAVYDTYHIATGNPWTSGNGTSIATPSWAALMAIIDQGAALTGRAPLQGGAETLPRLYQLAGSADFHAVSRIADLSGYASPTPAAAIAAGTVISPAFGPYNPWSGLGSPVANLLVPDMLGSRNTILGTVFDDLHAPAVPGKGNPGLAHWTVFLDANHNGRLDPGEASTTSDARGHYQFVVAPGTYSVRVVVPKGWSAATPAPGPITFAANPPGGRAVADFGFRVPKPKPPTPPTPPVPPTPPPPAPLPSLVSVVRVFGPRTLPRGITLRLGFSGPLDPALANDVGSYRVAQTGPFGRIRPVQVLAAQYEASGDSVTLVLGRFAPRRPLQFTIAGVAGARTAFATIARPS